MKLPLKCLSYRQIYCG